MNKGKLIQIFGSPASGKSTIASELHTELKKNGKIRHFLLNVE